MTTKKERRGTVWLVRHGETEWSASGKHTGRTDIPLTETGRHQARALRRHLEGRPFERVLVSPMQRARETCRIAGFGERAEVEPAITEWDYGVYEGRRTADIRKKIPGWSVWSHELPEGESVEDVGARVGPVVERLATVESAAVVFAHAHLLRVLAARWIGLPPEVGRSFTLGTASVSVLGWERENRVIVCWNQDWHLGIDVNP
jgi:broad specificity phosphatase PhoE